MKTLKVLFNIAALLVAVAIVGLFVSVALAQEFELNKPQVEEGFYCFTLKAAIDVVNEPSDSSVVLITHIASGKCIIAQAVVVYSRKVYNNGKVNVYEGKIGTITIFNPSLFTAKGEHDI